MKLTCNTTNVVFGSTGLSRVSGEPNSFCDITIIANTWSCNGDEFYIVAVTRGIICETATELRQVGIYTI